MRIKMRIFMGRKLNGFPRPYISELGTFQVEWYKDFLNSYRLPTLKQMLKITDIVEKEADITPDLCCSDLHIPIKTFLDVGLDIHTVSNIIEIFAYDFFILPDQNFEGGDSKDGFITIKHHFFNSTFRYEYKGSERQNYKNFKEALGTVIVSRDIKQGKNPNNENKNYLRSIHLVTGTLNPKDVIFLVFDEHYDLPPIRCSVKNNKGGDTYIKKLYNLAYLVNAPSTKVEYSEKIADNINNALFRKRQVKKYMNTNNFPKPTLVQKSEDKKLLVLKNEVIIKTGLIKHTVPQQFQSLYIDKTQ